MSKKATIKITGMSCPGCAAIVKRALMGVEGVSEAAVDLNAGRAVVEYDPDKADEQDLVKAVKDSGYGVG